MAKNNTPKNVVCNGPLIICNGPLIINGKITVEECSTFPDSFDKDLKFRQLYDFLKNGNNIDSAIKRRMNLIPAKSAKTSHFLRLPSIER